MGRFESIAASRWDPHTSRKFVNALAPIAKHWFRSQVHGLASFPPEGGALVVSNHSGGMLTPDVLIFSAAFYNSFGYDRPVLTLAHDALLAGPLAGILGRIGLIPAHIDDATAALRAGGVVLVFPGGIYDAYRPTLTESTIDFNGRTGYARLAAAAGVPIVPAVSIGGQESQLFLTRGTRLADWLRLKRFRSDILPLTVGFPFGPSMILPINVPLPTKIVTQVLEPIDIARTFGENPDVTEIDSHIRAVMQTALNRLRHQRRLPVLG